MNKNQTALITGASSGIGLEFARLLASEGYNLVMVARDETQLLETKRKLEEAFDIDIRVITKDLSKHEIATEICNELEKEHIQIDVLINNAGVGLFGDFADTDWNRESDILQLNVVTLTHLTKLLIPQMIKRKHGHVLNVASTASFRPGPLMSVYCATKAYVLSLSQAIAKEVAGTGVSVTALCPGPTDTLFNETAGVQKAPLPGSQKIASPREVAEFGYRAMLRGNSVAIHGLKNRATVLIGKFLPRQVITNLVYKKRKGWRIDRQS